MRRSTNNVASGLIHVNTPLPQPSCLTNSQVRLGTEGHGANRKHIVAVGVMQKAYVANRPNQRTASRTCAATMIHTTAAA